jgi:FHS family L-fucose permease-like MFS transporter
MFFMWGVATQLNDVLVPHLKAVFGLSYAQVMLIQFSFFSGYFVLAVPSGKLLERIGYQKVMVLGLVVMALGSLLFLPAARVPSYPLFLTAFFVVAAGITILQVAANPYVASFGSAATASSRLNLTQAFNSLGTTVAPLLGSALILSRASKNASEIGALSDGDLHLYRLQQTAPIQPTYLALAIVLLGLAVAIAVFHLPATSITQTNRSDSKDSIWKQRRLMLGVLGIFLYVGAEVSIGSFLVNYFVQPEIGNLTVPVAARYVSLYWGGAMVGRFIGSSLLQKIRASSLLGINAIAAAVLVMTTVITSGHVAMFSVLAVGLCNSIMFPTIFTLGIEGLGPLTGKGSGLLVCAIVGGAIIPELQGIVADRVGVHHAFILPMLSYIYIAYFAFVGTRQTNLQSLAANS